MRAWRHAILTVCFLVVALPAHAAHRVIVFVWDGMRPDAISAEDTPHLAALAARGSFFADNHATYPTFTMANATSFATGAFLGPAGFYGNRIWAPGAEGFDAQGRPVDFTQPVFTEDYAILRALDAHAGHALLELPTLLEAAHAKGLKTALIGKSGPAFLQDRRLGEADRPERSGVLLDENTALPLTFARALQQAGYPLPANTAHTYPPQALRLTADNGDPTAQGPRALLRDGVTSDPSAADASAPEAANAWLMKVFLEYVLPTYRPDLSIVWLRNPDSTEHDYGVGSPKFHRALQAQDALLGALEDRLAALGLTADTDLIVVSDHGHSNVAGPAQLFPLRGVNDGRVTGIDPEWGYSVSGGIRLADELTRAGFTAFDGTGCLYVPVLSGIRADGSMLHPTRYDDDGRLCGKPGPYTSPAHLLPSPLPKGALVIASNGGTEYLYQPEHDAALVARAVRFLQSREYIATVFVADRYGALPGTLPAERVRLEHATRGPDIIASYAWDAEARVQGFPGTEYASLANMRGQHGSFSPIDVHNTLLAAGPDFRAGFRDPLPSGNVDLAPTVAAVLGLSMPRAQGRVLHEALTGPLARPLDAYRVTAESLSPATPARGLATQRVDDAPVAQSTYTFHIRLKRLHQDGRDDLYFDQAAAKRQ